MNRTLGVCAAGLVAALAVGVLWARDDAAPVRPAVDPGREADAATIRVMSRDFAAAFNKHDARAIAAQWTEQGECVDADGETVRGRTDIEKAFGDFFKASPNSKIQVLVHSIRFPAPDLAIEEGVLRQVNSIKDLPASTLYSATHGRSGG